MKRTDVIAWVLSVTAALRLSPSKTLSVLVAAALATARVSLAELGRHLTGPAAAKHRIKRTWRFTANERIEVATALRGVVRRLRKRRRKRPLVVGFDGTEVSDLCTLRAAAVTTADEVRRLILKAKAWAESLGKTVVLWLSDRQEALVSGIAAEFPDVPHRYCANHCLRDVAQPVWEADRHAKLPMRKKVRGLRTIEQAVLQRQAPRGRTPATDQDESSEVDAPPVEATPPNDPDSSTPRAALAGSVVLDYCAAVRGILNEDQGGPLHPPSLRIAEALNEVHESIQRNLDVKKGGS